MLWNKVEDSLPEEGKDVFLFDKQNNYFSVGCLFNDGDCGEMIWQFADGYSVCDLSGFTHWADPVYPLEKV